MGSKHNPGQISFLDSDKSTTLLEKIMSLKVEDIKTIDDIDNIKNNTDLDTVVKQLELINKNLNNINNSVNQLTKLLENKLSFIK